MQLVIGGNILRVSQTSQNGKKSNENDQKRSWTVKDGYRW